MKKTSRVVILSAFASALLAVFPMFARAQRLDVAFGVSTIDAPGASAANGVDHQPMSLTGGAYPGFSGDVIFFHNLGIEGEVYWKASEGHYLGDPTLPYRPLFYDFNGIYSPRLAHHVYLDLIAGIGGQSTRFYCSTCFDPFTGTNYASVNHFMGDFGAALKLYPSGGFFIRPEARLYLVNNNLEFSSVHATRFGVSIGYTFR